MAGLVIVFGALTACTTPTKETLTLTAPPVECDRSALPAPPADLPVGVLWAAPVGLRFDQKYLVIDVLLDGCSDELMGRLAELPAKLTDGWGAWRDEPFQVLTPEGAYLMFHSLTYETRWRLPTTLVLPTVRLPPAARGGRVIQPFVYEIYSRATAHEPASGQWRVRLRNSFAGGMASWDPLGAPMAIDREWRDVPTMEAPEPIAIVTEDNRR